MTPRTTQITLVPEGEPLFSEDGLTVELTDEAGGEFVVVHCHTPGFDKIAINPHEWPALRRTINRLIRECRS